MFCWSRILLLYSFLLSVAAVQFDGMPDAAQIGQTIQLSLRMGDHDNFDPFDLLLLNSSSNTGPMLQHVTNVSLAFTVDIAIPSVPEGQYLFAAAEPRDGHIFSHSGSKFFVTNNNASVSQNPPILTADSTPPIIPSSIPSPSPHVSMNASNGSRQQTIIAIILIAVCGVILVSIALGLCFYRRQRRLRKRLEQPLLIAYNTPDGLAPLPPVKYSPSLRPSSLRVAFPIVESTATLEPSSQWSAPASTPIYRLFKTNSGSTVNDPPPVYR